MPNVARVNEYESSVLDGFEDGFEMKNAGPAIQNHFENVSRQPTQAMRLQNSFGFGR